MEAVKGLFHDYSQVGQAIDELQKSGFPTENIHVVALSHLCEQIADQDHSVHPATVAGAAGTATGNLDQLMSGIPMPPVPGVGPTYAIGSLNSGNFSGLSTLSGSGSIGGGVINALIGLGISEDGARLCESSMSDGGILMVVQTPPENVEEVQRILFNYGAVDVDEYVRQRKQNDEFQNTENVTK